MKGLAGVINIDMLHLQIAVFTNDKARVKFMARKGTASEPHGVCFASAHKDFAPDGTAYFSMVLKPEASAATIAHECVHVADFVMDHVGIPCNVENTEVRAYMVGYLFGASCKMVGKA